MGSEGVPSMVVEVMSMATVELTDASSWWHKIDDSPAWQDRISYTLVVLYGIVATVALVQLAWIQLRVVFHLINILVNGVRFLIFFLDLLDLDEEAGMIQKSANQTDQNENAEEQGNAESTNQTLMPDS